MTIQKTFEQMTRFFDDMIIQQSPVGVLLWNEFLAMHPADAAQFFADLDTEQVKKLFLALPQDRRITIFMRLLDSQKVYVLSFLNNRDRAQLLSKLSIDELTDVFDDLPDDALKKYIQLIHRSDREKVLELLKFDPDTAGGIMDTDVLTLMEDFTIEKSIKVLQRLQPEKVFYQMIFVTDQDAHLTGYIKLEDLVLKSPTLRLADIAYKDFITIPVDMDRQEVVQQMTHYDASIAPVVDVEGTFLGVITADTLVDVVEEEASEDIYRMATLTPMEQPYFETSFWKILMQRSSILVVLLLMQSISIMIIGHFEVTLPAFLLIFITMLTSTGGNSSSQTSAIIIQGLAKGEIDDSNAKRFLLRESVMALFIAGILGLVAFYRAYAKLHHFMPSFAISLSLFSIVVVSVLLGGCIPIILKRLNLDPAHSAGPLLATIMDIVGISIYCVIIRYMLY
jgi:magnesium transporter